MARVMRFFGCTAVSLVGLLSASGCQKSSPVPVSQTSQQSAPGAAEVAPEMPPSGQPREAATTLTGTVTETMDSGGYTYLKVATAEGEEWAAIMQTAIAVGQQVQVDDGLLMTQFTSRTLSRTFPKIYFGALHGAAPAVAKTTSPEPPATTAAQVTRAEGASGRTIAEVFAQKGALKDQPVAIRGRVTKLTTQILGKNWLHLQDGSGSAASKDFDLTVTSDAKAPVGSVVVVKGVVRLDRDFGAGYSYPVIVEDAKLEP